MGAAKFKLDKDGALYLSRKDCEGETDTRIAPDHPLYEPIVRLLLDRKSCGRQLSRAHRALNFIMQRISARQTAYEYFKSLKLRQHPVLSPDASGQGSAQFSRAALRNSNLQEDSSTMKTNTSKEWIARLNLPEITCTIVGNNKKVIEDTITQLLAPPLVTGNHKVRFDNGPNGAVYLYHETFLKGNEPFGWIAEYEVPTNLSVQTTLEQRTMLAQHGTAGSTR